MFKKLMDALPSQCLVCHGWPSRPVCADCQTQFAAWRLRCQTCALPVPLGQPQCGACLKNPPSLLVCLAAVDYAYPWSSLMGSFKFNAQPGLASVLADLLSQVPGVAHALQAADVLLPIPLSVTRLRQRGFNQALELARVIAARRPGAQPRAVDAHLLLRIRETPAQAGLGRSERLRNLQGAFAVDPLRISKVQGRKLLLVDDVMTSGASLNLAAQVLLAAGAASVSALVFARTPP